MLMPTNVNAKIFSFGKITSARQYVAEMSVNSILSMRVKIIVTARLGSNFIRTVLKVGHAIEFVIKLQILSVIMV